LKYYFNVADSGLKINLKFVGPMALKAGNNRIEYEIPHSITFAEAIKIIFKNYKFGNVDFDERGIKSHHVKIFLNGHNTSPHIKLKENDEISFFPPVSGG
jgi:molybdopterin converting factor small subunit